MIRSSLLYYTQVYLTDPAGRVLQLRAGTGEVGEALLKRGHRLMIDYNSLNGRAALEKKPVIVADTLENPNFKPNPLLPKTRSEMAVPLIVGVESWVCSICKAAQALSEASRRLSKPGGTAGHRHSKLELFC
jgi:hypothetical protein